MNVPSVILGIGLLCVFPGGCTGWPEASLDSYLGPQLETNRFPDLSGVIQTGLVVINNTTALDSAPQLSEAAFAALTGHVRNELMRSVRIEGVPVTHSSNPGASPRGLPAMLEAAREQSFEYLVVVILSSTEGEVPERFPWRGSSLGGIGRGLLSGYRAENLALAELALVDVRDGDVLARVKGYAWASLDRLAVPIESNAYPVVRRNLEDPPIYPENEEDAHDVMRSVAGADAVNQAVMHLQEAWGRR